MHTHRAKIIMWVFIIATAFIVSGSWQGAWCAEVEQGTLKEEMRMPWTGHRAEFIREWLLCGSFPSPPRSGYEHPRQGYDIDYLVGMGGEAAARPNEGQEFEAPDGTIASWMRYDSEQDMIDLISIFSDRQNLNAVAYGYTIINRDEAVKAVLALGSDDSVKVWLNGKLVHKSAVGRGVTKDEDIAPVSLNKGDNALLIKVETGTGGWGFVVRVLSESQALALEAGEIRPRIEPSPDDNPDLLVIKTDTHTADKEKVLVEAIASGGKIMESIEPNRGQKASFDTGTWPDGPYEIRVSRLTPEGYRIFRHLPWYKGDWKLQVRELLEKCDSLPEKSGDPSVLHYRVVRDLVLDRIGGDLPAEPDPEAWSSIHSPLMENREIDMGDSSCIRPHGFIRLAWIDEIDNSPQFCRAYLPPDYDPAKKWPMVVILHGYNGSNPEYINWWSITERHSGNAERHNVIVIEPHGRGNTWYNGIGEMDVLKAISIAKEKFSVDDDRVYLTGYSMGGGGTWHIGTRNPELFAAIGPIYGGWDYRIWGTEEELSKLTPYQRFVEEGSSSFAQADSLLSTPIFVNHGDADSTVDITHSRYAVRMLQRWGYNIRYWEHPDKGHGGLGCEEEMIRWFLTHRPGRNPREVRVRSAFLETASAHWVRVEQHENPLEFIVANCQVVDPREITVDTKNVLQLRMTPGDEIVDHDAPVRILWNGEDTGVHDFSSGAVIIRASDYEPAELHKKPETEGPIDDLTTTPFAIVVGTVSENPEMRRFCLLRAEAARDAWKNWQHVKPRYFLDTEITDEQIKKYSLQLFGGPSENLVARKLSQHIPLIIEPDKITIDGQAFPVEDAAVSMIYPHPLNSGRYVSIIAANSPAGMLFTDSIPGNVDFAIADLRTNDNTPFEKTCVVLGKFDHNWRYNEKYVLRGDPTVRSSLMVEMDSGKQETMALMNMLTSVWGYEEESWAEVFSSPMSAIAEELGKRCKQYGFVQRVEDNLVLWLDELGELEVMFAIIPDPTDLSAVREIYEQIHSRECPLTYAIVHQIIDGQGTYDIFQLSFDGYMSHDWRVSLGNSPSAQMPEGIRQDLNGMFSSLSQQENREWAEAFSADAAMKFGEVSKQYNCTQQTEEGSVLWLGEDDKLEVMFLVIPDPEDLNSFRKIYELIDIKGCPLTYVVVPVSKDVLVPVTKVVYDIFRLSLASYMEHCNRVN